MIFQNLSFHVLSGLPAGQAGNLLILDSGSAFGRPE
jgi:hypothetical protein